MRWFKWLRWYAAALVLRCSPLNRALALGLDQRSTVLMFLGFFSQIYTWPNVPLTFAPVALDVKFSLCFQRLRFLTFGLFLWCCFFFAEMLSTKLRFFDGATQVWSQNPLLIWKRWKRVVKYVFLLTNLRLEVSFKFGSCPFGFSVLSFKFRAIFQYLGECQRL